MDGAVLRVSGVIVLCVAAAAAQELGDSFTREGRYAEAVREYKSALASDAANIDIRFKLGSAYYRSADFLHAAEEFEKVRASELPESDRSIRNSILLADCYQRRGEYAKVIAVLDPIADLRPDDLGVAYQLGSAYLHENDEERGMHILERIMSRADTAEARLLLAMTKMRALDLNGALAQIRRCLELNPGLAEAHVIEGRILLMGADSSAAEAAFRRALELDPNSFDALVELGTNARQQDRLDEAAQMLGRALAIRSGDVRVRYQLALVETAAGRDGHALQLLEGVVKDAPNSAEAHRSLAGLYYRLHRQDDAHREKETAQRLEAEQKSSPVAPR
jgi:tetratricopeptide (TPR) repeat protein